MAYTPLTTEEHIEINKRRREEEHRRAVEQAPTPQPRPIPPVNSREWDARWPTQEVVELKPANETRRDYAKEAQEEARRASQPIGGYPADNFAKALADIEALKAWLQRINQLEAKNAALEARVARLEDILGRQLGSALNTDGKVHR